MKEKSKIRLAVILSVLYLLCAYKCSAQMKFSCGKTDTIYVNIASDRLFSNCRLLVSCSGHNHSEWQSITIGFIDGDALEVYRDGGYLILNTEKLSTTKFDYISFDEKDKSRACVNIKTKDFFIKYLSSVKN